MNWLKKYRNCILICLFGLISLNSYSFRLENIHYNQRMDGEHNGYREFHIVNESLVRQRYRVNVLSASLKDGSKFIKVYPKVITVEPQSKGVVKVFAEVPQNTKKQEYNFRLQFQAVNIPTLSKRKDGATTGIVNIPIAPIIGLEGYVGEIDFAEALKLENIEIQKNPSGEGVLLKGTLSNNSYASIEFGAEAYGSNDFLYDGAYVGNIAGNTKDKKIQLLFPRIKNAKDLKKIIFSRAPSDKLEVIKEIKLEK